MAPASLVEGFWAVAPDSVETVFWPLAGMAVSVATVTWPLAAVLVTGNSIWDCGLPTAAVTVSKVTTPLVAVLAMTVMAGAPTTPEIPVAGGCTKFAVEFAKLKAIPGRNGLLGVICELGAPVGVTGTRGQVRHALVMITVLLLPPAVGTGHVGHGAVAVTTVLLPIF